MKNYSILKLSLCILFFALVSVAKVVAQTTLPYVRIVEIEIKPDYLEEFKVALKEDVESALKNEQGVVGLYAVYDNNAPNHITVFEVFINKEAHQRHQSTPNFEKYKSRTAGMALSTERREVTSIVPIEE